jgi:hypothetical protein
MTITDVNAMENWSVASKKGLASYRATNSDWLDKATIQYTMGMLQFQLDIKTLKNRAPVIYFDNKHILCHRSYYI